MKLKHIGAATYFVMYVTTAASQSFWPNWIKNGYSNHSDSDSNSDSLYYINLHAFIPYNPVEKQNSTVRL